MIERLGINKKSIQRIADKALSDGITHSQTKGKLNRYVTKLYFVNSTANNIRLFGDKAFIFANNKLITVIQIPSNLTKNIKTMSR